MYGSISMFSIPYIQYILLGANVHCLQNIFESTLYDDPHDVSLLMASDGRWSKGRLRNVSIFGCSLGDINEPLGNKHGTGKNVRNTVNTERYLT